MEARINMSRSIRTLEKDFKFEPTKAKNESILDRILAPLSAEEMTFESFCELATSRFRPICMVSE